MHLAMICISFGLSYVNLFSMSFQLVLYVQRLQKFWINISPAINGMQLNSDGINHKYFCCFQFLTSIDAY